MPSQADADNANTEYLEPPKHERSPSAQMSLEGCIENKSQGSSKGDPCINLNLQPTLIAQNSDESASPDGDK